MRIVNQSRRRLPGRFRADVAVISGNSLLETPPDGRYQFSRLVDEINNTAMLTLDFEGNKYSFPKQLEGVLEAMSRRRRFRLRDLPGGHDNEALVGLAGYLQNIGFLTSIG